MPQKKRKMKLFLYIPFWLLIIGMFSGILVMQAARYDTYRHELDKVSAELAQEQQVGEDLLAEADYYDSDAYIEQIARDQLGYVCPDELVFINVAP